MPSDEVPDRDRYHHGDLRRALLEHAIEEVRRAGASAFGLRAAARALGVDAAAAYRHFANRRAVLDAVARAAFEALARRMESARDDAEGPTDRFLAIGRAYVRFATADPHWFQLAFGPEGAGRPGPTPRGVGASGLDPYELLVDALQDLTDAQVISVAIEEAVAAAWSSVHGLSHLLVEGLLDVDPEVAVEQVLLNTLDGLRSRGTVARERPSRR